MVSKVAVIALVAIVACPILLGYAFNLTETTETDYRVTGESVNVTPLLQNGTGYSYANANIYQLNTDFSSKFNYLDRNIAMYQSKGSAATNLYLEQRYMSTPGSIPPNVYLNNWFHLYSLTILGNSNSDGVVLQLYEGGNLVTTLYNVKNLYFSDNDNVVNIDGISYGGYDLSLSYITVGTPATTFYESWYSKGASGSNWVNFAGGFKLFSPLGSLINLPDNTKEVTITINLDSITTTPYKLEIEPTHNNKTFILQKDSSSKWYAGYNLNMTEIYTDPSRSDNTYQLTITFEKVRTTGSTTLYDIDYDLDYVGSWPSLIGIANSYRSYHFDDWFTHSNDTYNMNYVEVDTIYEYPIMRVDNALFRAFEYPTIKDKTYDPSNFGTNPITTISNPQQYGTSLVFGGNTYTVTDGNITISGHKVPVKDLELSSIPNGLGTYDNKIGNTVISTTASPSTITFNGVWNASISTDSMESYTYTKTEWNVGEFGWDGIDHNFLMVGLITSLGVFVALGIYARKRGTGGIIPLMIVTGCAAAVFFVML